MELQDIGLALKEARRKAGLTQAEIAAPLGMSRATVSALEAGRCEEIGFSKLAGLLRAVGLELVVRPRQGRPTLDDLRRQRRES